MHFYLKHSLTFQFNSQMPSARIMCRDTAARCHSFISNPQWIALHRYIHSQNLVHRDVKPDNILISITTPVQMKLSDFGFVKKTSPHGTFTQSGLKGTVHWMAPEILVLLNDDSRDSTSKKIPQGTIQCDIFAAGCVFFYFLTRGTHPFGSKSFEIPVNILKNNPIELDQHKQSKYLICIASFSF
jgi:serine/threonine protein kinase